MTKEVLLVSLFGVNFPRLIRVLERLSYQNILPSFWSSIDGNKVTYYLYFYYY